MAAAPKVCGGCKWWRECSPGLGECTALPPRGPSPRDVERDGREPKAAYAFPVTPTDLKACGSYKRP